MINHFVSFANRLISCANHIASPANRRVSSTNFLISCANHIASSANHLVSSVNPHYLTIICHLLCMITLRSCFEIGNDWETTESEVLEVAVNDTCIWGIRTNGDIFIRTNASAVNPEGTGTRSIRAASDLVHISALGSMVWGLDIYNRVQIYQGCICYHHLLSLLLFQSYC